MQNSINNLFLEWSGNHPSDITALPPSGSYRQYFRISFNGDKTVIGAYNEDLKENKAFILFTNHFVSKGLPVPQILAESSDGKAYLLDDLGDISLLSFLEDRCHNVNITTEIRDMYRTVIDNLLLFQIEGNKGFDYTRSYPRAAFDRQSMMWDLNYFKYYFLKLTRTGFDEQLLENDFQVLCDYLLTADCNFFLYRDFQSRNIMLTNSPGATALHPYFIDYQGGRKGALYYDIASILFEAKTDLPSSFRQEMMEYYISRLSDYMTVDVSSFQQYYHAYAYIRTMQAMGAYGFRGLYERKKLFLQSIPAALKVLDWLTSNTRVPVPLPELYRAWRSLVESEYVRNLTSDL